MAHLEDLDLKRGTLFNRHPKVEGSWASAVAVDIIREDMLPFVRRYLTERGALEEGGDRDGDSTLPKSQRDD